MLLNFEIYFTVYSNHYFSWNLSSCLVIGDFDLIKLIVTSSKMFMNINNKLVTFKDLEICMNL